MKRLWRWSFNALALCSLLVCLTILAVWVRSYSVGDRWIWYDRDCSACYNAVGIGRGVVRYAWGDNSRLTGVNPAPGYYRQSGPDKGIYPIGRTGRRFFAIPGFYFNHEPADFLIVQVSLAVPFIISAIFPVIWLLGARRKRRQRRLGLCPVCGYDLRESFGRCPECGTARAAT
jgi:hypothetical protein